MRDEQVRGLDVAVDDAAAMRRVERVGDLPREVEDPRRPASGPALDEAADREPFEPLHRDERLSVVLAELVDGADVRMLERRGEACLPLEPGEPLARAAASLRRSLMATSRPRRMSSARNTTPMPPSPRQSSSR